MALFSFSTADEMADAVCEIFRNQIAELNLHKEADQYCFFRRNHTPVVF